MTHTGSGSGWDTPPAPTAIYVHFPFCRRRCLYCDFNTYAGMDGLIPRYVKALRRSIEASPFHGTTIETVYFGGGTPTLVPPSLLGSILQALRDSFSICPGAEISIEANPATCDMAVFHELCALGFNRLSLGVQSLQDETLQVLGRQHTAAEALDALRLASRTGFRTISVDLMFGVPGQSPALWRSDLERIVAEPVQHISAYCLMVEPETPMARLVSSGRLFLPAEDDVSEMFETTVELLRENGFEHYEISNYALAGHRCRHNLVYWHNLPYLGFGAGAVSYDGCVRSTSAKNPTAYIEKTLAGQDAVENTECVSPLVSLEETLMLGLRMRSGLRLSQVRERYGDTLHDRVRAAVRKLLPRGMLEVRGDYVRIADHAVTVADSVIVELLAEVA